MSEWVDVTHPDNWQEYSGNYWTGTAWRPSNDYGYSIELSPNLAVGVFAQHGSRIVERFRVSFDWASVNVGSYGWLLESSPLYAYFGAGWSYSIEAPLITTTPFSGLLESNEATEVWPLVELVNLSVTCPDRLLSLSGSSYSYIHKIEVLLSGTSAQWRNKIRTEEVVL